ncbi:MAG: 4,5-DOPA dioxygenase extradiol [Clostridiales bacterium 38-18]|nr:MAG: 4,5-DOPA dioxygenase extradiol [Clostridiales bacterium 38-18]
MTRMPVIFAGHGNPMNAIEDNAFTQKWEELGKKIPKPVVILAISAHWYTEGTKTSDTVEPKQIYDMYGFPKALYELKYPVKGSKAFAEQLVGLLGDEVTIDNRWGIDHGTWSVLCKMFPEADIPVVQLSVNLRAPAQKHFEIGQKLKALRDQGVLIFASGNVVHNLSLVNWNMADGYPWAQEFDDYIKNRILAHDFDGCVNYERAGACAEKAFYTPDHYYPLLYALGAVDPKDTIEVYNDKCLMGAMSMTGYYFY